MVGPSNLADDSISKGRANDRQVGGDHYKAKFQHWDLIAKNRIGYLEGVATKYPMRWKKKNGAEDVEKAIHYCDKILDLIETDNYRPTGHAPSTDLFLFFNENGITDIDEQMAISAITTWRKQDDIVAAQEALRRLLVKAEDHQRQG